MEGSIYDMIIRVAIPSLCQLKQSEGWLAGAANPLTIGKDFNPRPKEPRNSFRFWLNLPQSGTGCTGLINLFRERTRYWFRYCSTNAREENANQLELLRDCLSLLTASLPLLFWDFWYFHEIII